MPDRLLRSVRRLAGALARFERRVAADHDVSASQLKCLLALLDAPDSNGLRLTDLADEQGLALSTMTRNTLVLERRGWLRRADDADDGRALRLALTDAGRDLATRLRDATGAGLSQAFAAFHPSDRVERAVAIERVATAIEKTHGDA